MSGPEVEIYTSPLCGFCHAAKRLLRGKGVAYTEVSVWLRPRRRRAMRARAGGRRSLPQVFIGGVHVGGYDDLHALDRAGELDAMLRG